MKPIIDVISEAVNQDDVKCLPCERINLDYHVFSEYLDSDEHKAEDLFENPIPNKQVIKIKEIPLDIPTVLSFFIDGSRRTYKIADLLVKGRYLPLVAGQIGVAVVERNESGKIKPLRELCVTENIIAFPDKITSSSDVKEMTERIKTETGHSIKAVRYRVKDDHDPVDLAIAKIMTHMVGLELSSINYLSANSSLNVNSILVKDGPLRYKNLKGHDFDITQFRNVIGVSKTFRPSFTIGKGRSKKDVGVITSQLQFGERTPVFKTVEDGDKYIGMWYMRIRPKDKMSNPLQGIIKVECYAIGPEEIECGLDTERVNTISSYLIKERNVTPYGSDSRWATHLYPIYKAESYIKASLISDLRFKAMF